MHYNFHAIVRLTTPFVLAFLFGAVVFYVLARTERKADNRSIVDHVRRASPLYFLVGALVYELATNWHSKSFWLFGGLLIWPTLVLLGGIVGDLSTWRPTPRS